MDKKLQAQFKKILEKREQEILAQLNDTNKEIEGLMNSEPNDSVDFSTISTGAQIEESIETQLKSELKHIKDSLKRMQEGTYGICIACGEQINPQRLKIKPHARYCINCREKYEQEKEHK